MFGCAVVLAMGPAGLTSWPFPAMVLAVVGGGMEEMIWSPNDASTDGQRGGSCFGGWGQTMDCRIVQSYREMDAAIRKARKAGDKCSS